MMSRRQVFSLKDELEKEMNRAAIHNGLFDPKNCISKRQQGQFVSNKFVAGLLDEENLAIHLRQKHKIIPWPWPLPPYLSQLSTRIRNECPILYCILVLLDEENQIQDLLKRQPSVDDKMLFDRHGTKPGSFCSLEKLKTIFHHDEFATRFYEKQWHFPPKLYQSDGIPSFEPEFFKMPFVDGLELLGSGGYGNVYGTMIASEYVQNDKTRQTPQVFDISVQAERDAFMTNCLRC